ncbi:MAG: TonB-dependent receptor [Candidatus Latescibacterota bacterium]|nr:TonB-dependent receptor [Candidatus Latescibacterota bacterium]
MSISLSTNASSIDLQGRVLQHQTRAPIIGALVSLQDSQLVSVSKSDGSFGFSSLNPRVYVLTATHIGYENFRDTLLINDKIPEVEIFMHPRVATLSETIVVEKNIDRISSKASINLNTSQLRSRLKNTLAETLSNQAGFSKRSTGPGTSRPVVRGMGDARLLVLEDGQSTGDLSASSPDHATVIEPMTSETIALIRGPETVRYGSNALAGIVNSEKNLIANSRPNRWTRNIVFSSATASSGWAYNTQIEGVVGEFTFNTNLMGRKDNDTDTPIGLLVNTESQRNNYGFGIGRIDGKDRFGTALSLYSSTYGIAPDPIGGHPKGVNIELERKRIEFELDTPLIILGLNHKRLNWSHSITRYYHAEYESSGILGTEFGVITHSGGFRSPRKDGEDGLSYEYRDYASGGFSNTPETREYGGAIYSIRNWKFKKWELASSLRWDIRNIVPKLNRTSSTIGQTRKRLFRGFSGGASLQHQPVNKWGITFTLMRSFRAPTVEELFSSGPHLAAYSYEVGNTDLDLEKGLGIEVATTWDGPKLKLQLAIFENRYRNFLYAENTGSMSLRRADLPLYQVRGQNARFRGAEGNFLIPINNNFKFFATASYVNGTFLSNPKQAIPQIPPLLWQTGFKWSNETLQMRFTSRGASAQRRNGIFEDPTEGYLVSDVTVEYSRFKHKMLNTLVLSVDNINNILYRNHLNRIRSVMPEPGRNIRLLYQLYF